MSSNIYWEPVVEQKKEGGYGVPLKSYLKHRYDLDSGRPVILDWSDNFTAGYFTALAETGCEGALELLESLKKHGKLKLTEVF